MPDMSVAGVGNYLGVVNFLGRGSGVCAMHTQSTAAQKSQVTPDEQTGCSAPIAPPQQVEQVVSSAVPFKRTPLYLREQFGNMPSFNAFNQARDTAMERLLEPLEARVVRRLLSLLPPSDIKQLLNFFGLPAVENSELAFLDFGLSNKKVLAKFAKYVKDHGQNTGTLSPFLNDTLSEIVARLHGISVYFEPLAEQLAQSKLKVSDVTEYNNPLGAMFALSYASPLKTAKVLAEMTRGIPISDMRNLPSNAKRTTKVVTPHPCIAENAQTTDIYSECTFDMPTGDDYDRLADTFFSHLDNTKRVSVLSDIDDTQGYEPRKGPSARFYHDEETVNHAVAKHVGLVISNYDTVMPILDGLYDAHLADPSDENIEREYLSLYTHSNSLPLGILTWVLECDRNPTDVVSFGASTLSQAVKSWDAGLLDMLSCTFESTSFDFDPLAARAEGLFRRSKDLLKRVEDIADDYKKNYDTACTLERVMFEIKDSSSLFGQLYDTTEGIFQLKQDILNVLETAPGLPPHKKDYIKGFLEHWLHTQIRLGNKDRAEILAHHRAGAPLPPEYRDTLRAHAWGHKLGCVQKQINADYEDLQCMLDADEINAHIGGPSAQIIPLFEEVQLSQTLDEKVKIMMDWMFPLARAKDLDHARQILAALYKSSGVEVKDAASDSATKASVLACILNIHTRNHELAQVQNELKHVIDAMSKQNMVPNGGGLVLNCEQFHRTLYWLEQMPEITDIPNVLLDTHLVVHQFGAGSSGDRTNAPNSNGVTGNFFNLFSPPAFVTVQPGVTPRILHPMFDNKLALLNFFNLTGIGPDHRLSIEEYIAGIGLGRAQEQTTYMYLHNENFMRAAFMLNSVDLAEEIKTSPRKVSVSKSPGMPDNEAVLKPLEVPSYAQRYQESRAISRTGVNQMDPTTHNIVSGAGIHPRFTKMYGLENLNLSPYSKIRQAFQERMVPAVVAPGMFGSMSINPDVRATLTAEDEADVVELQMFGREISHEASRLLDVWSQNVSDYEKLMLNGGQHNPTGNGLGTAMFPHVRHVANRFSVHHCANSGVTSALSQFGWFKTTVKSLEAGMGVSDTERNRIEKVRRGVRFRPRGNESFLEHVQALTQFSRKRAHRIFRLVKSALPR